MTPVQHKPSQRVFVGIKMADDVADTFVKLQADIADLPARFIPPPDLHLTLVPPWEMRDRVAEEYRLRTALSHAERFTLELLRLSYGPDPLKPRLAWVECAASRELVALKKELTRSFGVRDKVPFTPHVTIARFKDADADMLRARPIERPVAVSMPVESVELFASPNKGGVGYTVLASIPIPSRGMAG